MLRRRDAARGHQSRAVVRARKAHDLDVPSGLGRVHHPTVADVEADMAESIEDEDIARLHPRLTDSTTLAVQRVRAVRQIYPHAPVRPAHEARAVEAGCGRLAAPAIRRPDGLERDLHGPFGARRRRRLLARRPVVRAARVVDGAHRARGDAGDDDRKRERKQAAAGAGRHREEKDGRRDATNGSAHRPGLFGTTTG